MDKDFTPLTGKMIHCPVCQEKTALEEKDTHSKLTSWLCVNCGFMSVETYRENTKELRNVLKGSPQLIIDSKFFDEKREIYWIPTIINMPTKGLLFPIGTPKNLIWNYAPIEDIPIEEQKNYPVPGKEGHFYSSRMSNNVQQCINFYEALKAMGAIIRPEELEKIS